MPTPVDHLTAPTELERILELALLERRARPWGPWLDELHASGVPLNAEDDDDEAAAGGSDDDDEEEGNPAGDGGKDDDDDGDEDEDDLSPAEKRARRAEKAAAKANRELREHKRREKEREAEAKKAAGKWRELAEEREAELEELRQTIATERKRTLAMRALEKAGAKKPERRIRLLDLDAIEDEADADEAVAELKRDEPELFATGATRQARGGGRRADRDDDDDRGNGRQRPKPVGVDRIRDYYEKTEKAGSGRRST